MSEGSNTTGQQLCAYCRTELSADALVCEACGMSQAVLTAPALKPPPAPPAVPAPPALTGPALRPPPDPPATTAPTLLPPPDPPALTAPALRPAPEPPAVPAGDPLASGAAVSGGDPLASPPPAAGDPLAATVAGDPLAAFVGAPASPTAHAGSEPRAVPAASARPDIPPATDEPAVAAGSAGAVPAAPSGPDAPPVPPSTPPAAAHPSDATPPGYITAASLRRASRPRPSSSTEAPTSEADPSSPPAASAAVGPPVTTGPAPSTLAPLAAAGASPAPVIAPSAPAQATPPRPPAAPNRARIDRRTAAIVAVIVVLATAATAAVLVLTGGSEPSKPLNAGGQESPVGAAVVAKTPEPLVTTSASKTTKKPDLNAQVKQLDGFMQLSKQGRAEAVKGDIKAATASRAKLLRGLAALRAKAADKDLKAALTSFIAAIGESLRQNRECGSKCSTADLDKVGGLKQAALRKLNPLLKAHGGHTYRRQEI